MKHFLLNLAIALSLAACSDKPKYSREECIVRVNIDWSSTSSSEKENQIRRITDATRNAPDLGCNEVPASSAIQGESREFIYYQYKHDCENRLENTRQLLRYVQRQTNGLPPLKVDKGSFKPSLNTISAKGPWWKNDSDD